MFVARIGAELTDIQRDSVEFKAETENEALGLVRLGLRYGHKVLVYEVSDKPSGGE